MLQSVDDPPPRILPLRVLLVMLLACLGGSWFMVPREDELIERLFKDRQYERVVAVLRDDVHGMTDNDVNGLRRLDESQLMTLSRLLNLTPREQLRTIFASKNTLTYDAFVHSIVTAAVRYVDVLPPQEAFDVIRPAVQRVPENLRLELLNIIAHNAHAVANPGLAAEVLTLACECKSADWKLARAMAQSYQWSGRLSDASKHLRVWLAANRQRLAPAEREEARQMTFALALESGSPSEAFDICLQELQDLPGAERLP
ncbi:MAG: hypothetical protein ACOYMN_13605, partial [Roseimicrobium sp.]